jgi:aryl-alcohol dehydrogenase-like predicted oxidoreductase
MAERRRRRRGRPPCPVRDRPGLIVALELVVRGTTRVGSGVCAMEMRTLGRLWPASPLSLGGGGLGQLWGSTSRAEAVAAVREAVDAGINLLDLAPRYGDGEAERVIGDAFGGRLPDGIRITTKHRVSNPPAGEVFERLERSLEESLERMRLEFVDLFFLHGYLVASARDGGERRTPRALYCDAVRPAFERLAAQGRIGAWGITAIGVPSVVLDALAGEPVPAAVHVITNPLDSPGEMQWFEEPARPREIIGAAQDRGIGVMGIRVVGAGALTDAIDRDVPPDSAAAADFRRAAPLRELARELGESTAALAHRYALSMPGVDTVVLGVKNRAELRECLAAAEKGPLPTELVERIDARVSGPNGGRP